MTGPPIGGVPVEVALLFDTPALTSACVIVCVPVHVVLAPGASVVTGHTAAASNCASFTTIPVNVTLPVLVTKKVYAIVLPAVVPLGVPAVLSIVNAGLCGTGVTIVTVHTPTPPAGHNGLVTVPVFVIDPVLALAKVAVYVPTNTHVPPGATVGQVMLFGVIKLSATVTFNNVVLPVLVIVNV